MDEFKKSVLRLRAERAVAALHKNNMQACFVETKEEVAPLVETLLHDGDTVSVGGSKTLEETGLFPLLKSGRYRYLDRYAPGLGAAGAKEVFRAAFSADAYLMSANAVTENGELYNVDGNSNRVAALLYGPDSVIVVAGVNKLVPDLDAARRRVRELAAPANAARLHSPTPCVKTGRCMDCTSPARICCNYVVSAQQRQKDRIKVILVGEALGY